MTVQTDNVSTKRDLHKNCYTIAKVFWRTEIPRVEILCSHAKKLIENDHGAK